MKHITQNMPPQWWSITPLPDATFHGLAIRQDSKYPSKTSDNTIANKVCVIRTSLQFPPISMPEGVLIVRQDIAEELRTLKRVSLNTFDARLVASLDNRVYFAPELAELLEQSSQSTCNTFVEVRAAGYWESDVEKNADGKLVVRWNLPPAEDIEEEKVNIHALSQYQIFDFGGETFLINEDLFHKWKEYLPSEAFCVRQATLSRLK